MGQIILVASGKGGTGKTTTTANIGAALAETGKLVVLVDMDMGLRNLDIVLGLESSIVYDISDVIDGAKTIDEALIRDKRYENLYFLPAPQTRGEITFKEEDVKRVWEQLKSRFDYCIIDAAAGVTGSFTYAAISADKAIIVTMPELTAVRDADRVVSVLEDIGISDSKVVINRVRADMIKKGIMMNMDDCVDMLQIPVLGIVPDDDELVLNALSGTLAVSAETSRAGTAFRNIAARILGENIPIMNFEVREGLYKKLRNFFTK